jgi:hypothetical protein
MHRFLPAAGDRGAHERSVRILPDAHRPAGWEAPNTCWGTGDRQQGGCAFSAGDFSSAIPDADANDNSNRPIGLGLRETAKSVGLPRLGRRLQWGMKRRFRPVDLKQQPVQSGSILA